MLRNSHANVWTVVQNITEKEATQIIFLEILLTVKYNKASAVYTIAFCYNS